MTATAIVKSVSNVNQITKLITEFQVTLFFKAPQLMIFMIIISKLRNQKDCWFKDYTVVNSHRINTESVTEIVICILKFFTL